MEKITSSDMDYQMYDLKKQKEKNLFRVYSFQKIDCISNGILQSKPILILCGILKFALTLMYHLVELVLNMEIQTVTIAMNIIIHNTIPLLRIR